MDQRMPVQPGRTDFSPVDAAFEARVHASFGRQAVMAHLGARLARVEPGRVEIALPFRAELSQQNGFLHAGIAATIADSAGGYAAYSLFAPGEDVLTTEFKLNLLNPARGERFTAVGQVIKSGRTLSICEVAVHGHAGGQSTQCVHGLMTLFRVAARSV